MEMHLTEVLLVSMNNAAIDAATDAVEYIYRNTDGDTNMIVSSY